MPIFRQNIIFFIKLTKVLEVANFRFLANFRILTLYISWSRFCTVNCQASVSNYQLYHIVCGRCLNSWPQRWEESELTTTHQWAPGMPHLLTTRPLRRSGFYSNWTFIVLKPLLHPIVRARTSWLRRKIGWFARDPQGTLAIL